MSAKVLSVFGTRPEAIKMAPVVRALERVPGLVSRVCVTAQHREMLDQPLALFGIRPDHDLDLMAAGQDLYDLSARMLLGLREVLRAETPDLVLVHGDTTTCLAASLAAFYAGVRAGHVEAGLRSGDARLPFPEEMNRVLADRLCALHFAPTERSRQNLLREGLRAEHIHLTGNTVIDALLWVRERAAGRPALDYEQAFGNALCRALDRPRERLILVTGHRRESFGPPFERICAGIGTAARAHPGWLFVYPVHKNPNVQRPAQARLSVLSNVLLCDPLDYEPFVWLMDHCDLLLTDSGGIQEEGPALGKPVLVTRELTERHEALEAGTVRLVGSDPARIAAELERVLLDPLVYERMARAHNPYGDGHAAERIARVVERELLPNGELLYEDEPARGVA